MVSRRVLVRCPFTSTKEPYQRAMWAIHAMICRKEGVWEEPHHHTKACGRFLPPASRHGVARTRGALKPSCASSASWPDRGVRCGRRPRLGARWLSSAGMRQQARRTGPRPPYHSDADELLEAVVAAGFGRVEGAVGVHPRPVHAAGDKLAWGLALLPPAADFGAVAFPDLDAGTASNVERAVGVEGDPVGVGDMLLQTDKRAVGREDLPAVVLAVHHIDQVVLGDQQLVRHVELARVGAGSAGHGPEVEPPGNKDGVAAAEGEEILTAGREAVDAVLTVPVGDEDVPVGRLNGVGRHIEGLAVGARRALGPERQEQLARRRVFGDGVKAGIRQVNLAGRVDPDAMRGGGHVAPAADLVPISVEDQDVPDAAQDGADRAVLPGITDARIDPAPRVDADIGDRAADCHLGPMFYYFILVIAEPDTLRHGSPPTVGSVVSVLHARRSLVSIP